jgi:hypothetical protein
LLPASYQLPSTSAKLGFSLDANFETLKSKPYIDLRRAILASKNNYYSETSDDGDVASQLSKTTAIRGTFWRVPSESSSNGGSGHKSVWGSENECNNQESLDDDTDNEDLLFDPFSDDHNGTFRQNMKLKMRRGAMRAMQEQNLTATNFSIKFEEFSSSEGESNLESGNERVDEMAGNIADVSNRIPNSVTSSLSATTLRGTLASKSKLLETQRDAEKIGNWVGDFKYNDDEYSPQKFTSV